MSKKYTITIITTFLIIFNIVVFKYPQEIVESSKLGLQIWYKNLVPSLLPFIFINNLARESGVFYIIGNLLCTPLSKFLGISNISTISYISALFSGYPIGSKLASDNCNNMLINKEEARHVSLFSNIPSPLFTMGTVGVTLFHNQTLGIYLLCIQITTSFLLAFLLGKLKKVHFKSNQNDFKFNYNSFNKTLSFCISNSISTITVIGMYVVLLSIITKIFTILGVLKLLSSILCLLLTPIGINENLANSVVIGFFEMTSAIVYIAEHDSISQISTSIISFILAFGGLSINSQCISFLGNIDVKFSYFILIKLIQAVIAFLLTFVTFNLLIIQL